MKLAYAALFTIALPLALLAWAMRLDDLLALPAIHAQSAGFSVAAIGALLMIGGVIALRVHGEGWPMSPYPPKRLVTRGVYALVGHPIYVGAVMLSAGISIVLASSAGLWVVTPVLALSCVAFVIGYERDRTVALFGELPSPVLRLPAASDERPAVADRLSMYVLVLLPWLIAFYAANLLAAAEPSFNGWSAADARVPILPWTELVYVLDYPLVLAVPLLLATRRQLRNFAIDGWIATALATLIYFVVPVTVQPRDVPVRSVFATLMLMERTLVTPSTAFPAFHVIWASIAAAALARAKPRLRIFWWMLASAISLSCLTTGMHAIADVIACAILSALVLARRRVVRLLIASCEALANSWREWDLGAVRMMSHGLYAAAGSFLGILIVARLTGESGAALAVGVSIVAGAGLWAQFIEGSPQLLRPFGYFGGVIGGSTAVLFTPQPLQMFAAYAVAAPVIQAFGRCRCLVQGCCHGRPSPEDFGIRYRHPRSRVTRLSNIAGSALFPTQLYSIAYNCVAFVVLLRLWNLHAPMQLIAGTYFIVSGLGRFVEEHFRGEPQTAIIGGLHSYQWLSIASLIAGAVLTCMGNTPAPDPVRIDGAAFGFAALMAFLTYAAYGVDFPRLNTRFARLV